MNFHEFRQITSIHQHILNQIAFFSNAQKISIQQIIEQNENVFVFLFFNENRTREFVCLLFSGAVLTNS